MKVIFLDIDGVLNTLKHLQDMQSQGLRVSDSHGHHIFDPDCVRNFNTLVRQTGAKIVLSSAWRIFGVEYMTELLKVRGVEGEVIGRTPVSLKPEEMRTTIGRGAQIAHWLKENEGLGIEEFVILDDDVSDINLPERTVRTSWEFGLTDEKLREAILILKG